ncbi:36534_t:CDS:2, partial [Racocetra persica]
PDDGELWPQLNLIGRVKVSLCLCVSADPYSTEYEYGQVTLDSEAKLMVC